MTDTTDARNESRRDEAGTARRDFLKGVAAAAAVGATGLGSAQELTEMTTLDVVDNPIGNYPYRD